MSIDPTSPDQNKWTASVAGQQYGNGVYEVKVSSCYANGGSASYQMWQIFDKSTVLTAHFALNHYDKLTGDYSFGNKPGYTLDSQYYG